MDDIYEILPTNDTKFWLYCLTKNNFNNLKKYKGMYISCFLHYEIKKNDILFIYSKEILKNGFAGICRAAENLKLNNKNNKIFNDMNMNKYIIKLNYITLFDNIVKINNIIDYIKFDKPGFRSIQSFRSKFVKKSVSMIKIDYQGEIILKKLFELTMEEVENTNIFLKKKKIEIIDEESSSYNPSLYNSTTDESIRSTTTIKSSSDSSIKTSTKSSKSSSKDSTIKTTSKSSKIKTADIIDEITVTKSKELEESSENEDGFIPILIIPCNDFKWKKMSEKYFIKHYKLCKNCEKTNNNNTDIGYFLNDAKIEIVDIVKEKNLDLTLAMNAYDSLTNYSPEESNETESIEETINSSEELSEYTEDSEDAKPFIQIIKVNNNHYLYDKCLFISWNY
jgi:hypothetical protein